MRNIYRLVLSVAVAATLMVLAAGCGTGMGEAMSSGMDSASDSLTGTDTLTGSTWRLVAWGHPTMLPEDVEITAQFADGQMTGTSGVNSYFASYTASSRGDMELGAIGQTRMAGPESAMEAETTFMSLLEQVRSYDLTGDILMLDDVDNNALLQFNRQGS